MGREMLDTRGFTGTENWYRHWLVKDVLYTDGVKYVADQAGAYWLIDEIAFAQKITKVAKEEFQNWTLKVDKSSGVLTCTDGGKDAKKARIVFTKRISFTDFPDPEITLWYTDNVILLPSEY